MIEIIERVGLAEAILPDGRKYGVVATRHNQDWPGTESPVTFAVEEYARRVDGWQVLRAWGFFAEAECYDFLTGTKNRKYKAWDRNGNEVSDVRKGLGISDVYIVRDVPEVA